MYIVESIKTHYGCNHMLSGRKNLSPKKSWCEFTGLSIKLFYLHLFCYSDVEDDAVSEANMIYASQV